MEKLKRNQEVAKARQDYDFLELTLEIFESRSGPSARRLTRDIRDEDDRRWDWPDFA
jgi:hypothetical protein